MLSPHVCMVKSLKLVDEETIMIKKAGTFEGKSNKLGGGGRFAQMVASGKSPALAAYIGRKLYGKKKMAQLSAKGRNSAK